MSRLHQEYGHIVLRVIPLRLEWQDVEYNRDALLDFVKVYNADEFGGSQPVMFCHHRGGEKLWFTEVQLERWVELGWFKTASYRLDLSMTG